MELSYGRVKLPPPRPIVAPGVTRPHRCPVCEGRGTMPHGFYDRATVAASTEPVKCRSCSGRGVIFV